LNEISIALREKEEKNFANNLLDEYLARGFGSLSKREIDVLMMNLLTKYTDVADMSNFDLSIKLKLTESKIKNLKYEANLKYREDTEEFIKNSFLTLLGKARLKKDKNKNITIAIAIEDNFLRNAISAKVKGRGSYTDTSFNSEIVKIDIDDFVYLLDIFYDDKEKLKIKKSIENLLASNGDREFKKLFKSFLEEGVKGAGSEIGKQGVLLGIGYLTGGGVPLVSNIISIIKG